jgi:hypothetical protein
MKTEKRQTHRMNYYELHARATATAGQAETLNPGLAAIAYAVLALTEQVQGLRTDLIPETDAADAL